MTLRRQPAVVLLTAEHRLAKDWAAAATTGWLLAALRRDGHSGEHEGAGERRGHAAKHGAVRSKAADYWTVGAFK